MRATWMASWTLRLTVGLTAALSAGCPGRDDSGGGGNEAPLADAGTDLSAETGEIVGLAGTGTDEDADILTYEWTFVSLPAGSQTVLAHPESTTPSFVADMAGDYTVQLVVNDGVAVAADAVVVSVTDPAPTPTPTPAPVNAPPVPDAGNDGSAPIHGELSDEPGTVLLDGTGTTDPDQDYVFHRWQITAKPEGSTAILNDESLAQPTLFVDLEGQYVVSLWASDDEISWAGPDSVVIDAAGADATTIVAGDSQSALVAGTLPIPLTVNVANEFGDGIAGVRVRFEPSGTDAVSAINVVTDGSGDAATQLELSPIAGPRTTEAIVITHVDALGSETVLDTLAFAADGLPGAAEVFTVELGAQSVPAGSAVSVTVRGQDVYGNPALFDDTTVIRLEASSASGTALFSAAPFIGTLLSGGNASFAEIQLEAGDAGILVSDNVAETVVVSQGGADGGGVYSQTIGPLAIPQDFFSTLDFAAFSFSGTEAPTGDGTLTVYGRGAFSGGGLAVGIEDPNEPQGFAQLGDVLDSASDCTSVAEQDSITVPANNLAIAAQDGQADIVLVNIVNMDPFACSDNDVSATLSYATAGAFNALSFEPGPVASVFLAQPADVGAGSPMLVEAELRDMFGNFVSDDDTTRFSITATSTSGAEFAAAAVEGTVVAGGGSGKVWVRVQGGRASVQLDSPVPHAVSLTLGDPVPGGVTATMSRNARFTGAPDSVVIVSGNGQTGAAGAELANPVVLEVRDAAGFPVSGVAVDVTATVNSPVVQVPGPTDAQGRVSVILAPGAAAGPNELVASVLGGSTDAIITCTGVPSAPAIVLLRNPVAPGSGTNTAVVRIEVHDASGNVVTSDDSTTFSVTADASAEFTQLVTGSSVLGLGSQVVLVTAQDGVVELELTDLVDETVALDVVDSLANGLSYQSEGVGGAFYSSNFESDDGGMVVFTMNGFPSWEHGVPQTQPAYSGSQVWATSLNGDYFDDETSCVGVQLLLPPAVSQVRSRVRYDMGFGDSFFAGVCDMSFNCSPYFNAFGSNGFYEEIVGDLTPYAGQTASILWCLQGDFQFTNGDGVFLDDVEITAGSGGVTVTFVP